VHNETLSVVAVRVSNADRSPVGINRCDAAQLQLDALRLSAIISQYFTRRILPPFPSMWQRQNALGLSIPSEKVHRPSTVNAVRLLLRLRRGALPFHFSGLTYLLPRS
jgi:hypothetical protein